MKRSTKLLITATVVATAVSVGAVSYAAWEAGNTQSKEITGNAGAINTIGELTVTPSDASGKVENGVITMNSLYPVDQGGTFRKYWEFEVKVTGEGTQTVTVKGELTKAVAEVGNAKLFYSTAAPVNATTGAVDTTVTAAAKQIAGKDANGQVVTAQEITVDATGKTATVFIYMTADNTDAMKAAIKLTFEASAAAE